MPTLVDIRSTYAAQSPSCVCCDSGYEADHECFSPALEEKALFCEMCVGMKCHRGEEQTSMGHFVHRFTFMLVPQESLEHILPDW